ncbi:hypothetical protein Gocc_2115 [Gaiella occulta]|uniref:Uncharacterized protein n=1 Tax=Gaiella occulta TaxID=1002870 RepID=A0A7M2YX25_9ACTN|nr:hypothetical protein [Gaiella occulta]RDI74018.1 hypothetical protein Gocc_2115 [Gaiella occulta]
MSGRRAAMSGPLVRILTFEGCSSRAGSSTGSRARTALPRISHHVYGDDLTVECPTGSGRLVTLAQVAGELSRRLASLFLPGEDGGRPAHGNDRRYADDPSFSDLVPFYEYFHGDSGRGVGASHQTGWTATVTSFLDVCGPERG